MIVTASRGIARIPHLASFVDEEGDIVVGWGMKPSGAKALAIARKRGLPCHLLEDGFLRSLERDGPPLSLIIDNLGVYYDASRPSRIEQAIARPLSHAETSRARALISQWCEARASKYNHAPDYEGALPARYVLVVDQTWGDIAISAGLAEPESFDRMLDAALNEYSDADIILKVHPDIFTHGKKGYFDVARLRANPRVHIIAQSCHAVRLVAEAQAVYTVTSQMGFDALIWGRPVRCFGMPFYAGWSLTGDEMLPPERRHSVSLEQLVYGALIAGPRYVDPASGARWEIEDTLGFVAEGRRALERKWLDDGYDTPQPGFTGRFRRYLAGKR